MTQTDSMTTDRLRPFGATIFARISALAREHGAVDLGQGKPDADGPDRIKQAAARAMIEHGNQYAPMAGVDALRDSLARRWAMDTGAEIDKDRQITVTSGCTEALAATCLGLLNPGDGVVVFEPFYDAYAADIGLAGAELRPVQLQPNAAGGFAFDEGELESACRGARALLLNTPHNPTGKVFSRAELERIARIVVEHDLSVISDEVYERLMFDGAEHVRIATLDGMAERTLTLGSFGKTFSMTGWKIGWAIGPENMTAAVRAAHQFLTYAVPTPLQHAAAEAIDAMDEITATINADLAARRDQLCDGLERLGLRFEVPNSGYFVLARHEPWSSRVGLTTDVEVVRYLIEEVGVAVIPPSVFYTNAADGQAFIRLAFCKTEATIAEALERLDRAFG